MCLDPRRDPQGISCPVGGGTELKNVQAGRPCGREVETGFERTEESGRGGVEALASKAVHHRDTDFLGQFARR